MREAAQPESKQRSFPRWSKQTPRCPKHNRRLKGSLERMPTWTSMAIGYQGKNAVRRVWRCTVAGCFYCLASDSQILLGKCERMHKALGRYREVE